MHSGGIENLHWREWVKQTKHKNDIIDAIEATCFIC